MFVDWLLYEMHLKSRWARLIAGSVVTALGISLGLVVMFEVMRIQPPNGVIATMTAIGTAMYAARTRE